MADERIIINKTWRSEITSVVLFVLLSIFSIWLTSVFPWSLVKGNLFSFGETNLSLTLPLFWFVPAGTLGTALYRIYNVKYSVDGRGIQEKSGILGLRTRTTYVRYEDIRSVELEQTLLERALKIGEVEIGTAATGETEILLRGIAAPEEVQEMIQTERDRRTKIQRERYGQAQVATA